MLSWESRYSIRCGGLAEHVTELGAALRRRGHDVHVFTRIAPGQVRYDCIDGAHYHRCPFEPHACFVTSTDRMCQSFIARVAEVEKFYDRPFDVVHGYDWLSVRGLVAAKNDRRSRTVLTMHSTEFGRSGNQLFDGQSRTIRDVEWEGTHVADRVICVSRALRDEVCRLYSVRDDKVSAVYNAVDVRRFDTHDDPDWVRRECRIDDRGPVVVFLGRLTWQKGPDLLVEAVPGLLHYHPEAEFIFVGDGDMRPSLEGRTAALGAGCAVRFLGWREGPEAVALLNSADVVCIPSRNEPFGIVVLEAWSARKPVVVTCNGGPAEFVRHGQTGLLVFVDKDSVGWGVGTALADRREARRMGRNGRREAET